MTAYSISINEANKQYIQFKAIFTCNEDILRIQLPVWRPGRYELGNFAKNVRNFKVYDQNNKPLKFHKINSSLWEIEGIATETISVHYQYYAYDLNAGSTFLNKKKLYVNPVNCMMYSEVGFHNEVQVNLEIPDSWEIACSLKQYKKQLLAPNFDELFDSPFICAEDLQHNSYFSHDVEFHLWFSGEIKVDWDRILKDFKAFTDLQISKFSEFPADQYHFLFHILPYRNYHGVEHLKSTVICLGPSYSIFEESYVELLGISSHELYHAWNVKSIRPIEMQPYDFTKENFSQLGYLCEGITTYMGDLHLLKSKVFSLGQYLTEFKKDLQKHFDNFGRFSYSVAQSSFDTWLDGYTLGTPERKVSIYTEGCLLAFVLDIKILKATSNKYSLDSVMKRLYFDFAVQGKGVARDDYKLKLEEVSGLKLDDFFKDYYEGTKSFEPIVTEALEAIGFELVHRPHPFLFQSSLGIRIIPGKDDKAKITHIYPGSPADIGGFMLDDEIIAINQISVGMDIDRWLKYFRDDVKDYTILRRNEILNITLPEVNRHFYLEYDVKVNNEDVLNGGQKSLRKAWMS